ncbi:hypothetical protein Ahy_B02g059052 [Arachis hypogaea]|uniref:PB1-like domain-containing protein n=1 Tax=Arachis hypogaea TaxID=3818 RepID=A0A445AG08_ARAHY|nr:hypothetical protein Ahy_B02g059052 [Arachis hypogaea]
MSSPSRYALSLTEHLKQAINLRQRRKTDSLEEVSVLNTEMEGPPMTFVFHHGGMFKNSVEGDMIYELNTTEVLMGVDRDTLDVFFVRGYYKELGYIEAGNLDNMVEGVLAMWKQKVASNRSLPKQRLAILNLARWPPLDTLSLRNKTMCPLSQFHSPSLSPTSQL